MKGETPDSVDGEITPPTERQQNPPAGESRKAEGNPDADRLERVEAALALLADHLQTSTKGSEILEAEHSRSLLSSIALGFSAIALIAIWSIDLARDDVDVDLVRFTIGMSLLLLASAVDLLSASLLRKAVHRAILEKEPSQLVLWHGQGHWNRFLKSSYWATIKDQSPEFYRHQLMRHSALAIYILAGVFLIWAVLSI